MLVDKDFNVCSFIACFIVTTPFRKISSFLTGSLVFVHSAVDAWPIEAHAFVSSPVTIAGMSASCCQSTRILGSVVFPASGSSPASAPAGSFSSAVPALPAFDVFVAFVDFVGGFADFFGFESNGVAQSCMYVMDDSTI